MANRYTSGMNMDKGPGAYEKQLTREAREEAYWARRSGPVTITYPDGTAAKFTPSRPRRRRR